MNTQAPFTLRARNPDVLECIANLSNDEVFTPPGFAGRMLDTLAEAWAADHSGANLWADPTVRFLDPCTKSGVFLREITRRLVEGLKEQIPDLQERVNHILTQQVFGIGITRLTAMMARRSVYCSKHANGPHSICTRFTTEEGNIWFERVEHTWKDERCRYCGAAKSVFDRGEGVETHAYAFIHTDDIKNRMKEIFGGDMQFDVIIGNPPYQLDDGGFGRSASPIYHLFVQQAKNLEPRYLSLVIPARWYAGGKGLDEFRAEMLNDNRLREIHDFPDATDVFPGVQIKGGICYFLWDRDHRGLCRVCSYVKQERVSEMERPLLEEGADVFIRYNEAIPILEKVRAHREPSIKGIVSTRKPFGLPTNYIGKSKPFPGAVKLYQNGGVGYVWRDELTTGHHLIEKWKVLIPYLGSGSDSFPHPILGRPLLGEPNSACTETYMCIGPVPDEMSATNLTTYISTRLFRFLVLLQKPTQHAPRRVYTFVPMQDFSKPWTDEELYAKYGLTQDEIAFIESMVRPMDLTSANQNGKDWTDDEE